MRALLSVMLFGALGACATGGRAPQLEHAGELLVDGVRFRVEYTDADKEAATEVLDVLAGAARKVTTWGAFTAPVTVYVLPDHEQLESAVNRHNYPWLRAWARYKVIFLQSPRTWGLFGGSKKDLAELITHELTHCLMYQLSASEDGWPEKRIPLWFREGMASYTADQGYRRPKERELWAALRDHPGADPVGDADSMYQAHSDTVYGAAHRAFEFLVNRHGRDAVEKTMAGMKRGLLFPAAFQAAVGMAQEEFEQEFMRYIQWQGWL